MEQQVGTTHSGHGTLIAYATAGSGNPLLYAGGWLSHLELSWALPAERHMLQSLATGCRLVRYDHPGCGLSQRVVPPPTLDSELSVVEAVLDATGVQRADVVAVSLGVPLLIAWAARHPERVGRLVLYGGWARGAGIAPPAVQDHVVGLVTAHWGLGSDVLTDIFLPDATAGTRAASNAYQRQSSSPDTAAGLLRLSYAIDVTASLPQVRAPTLVVHREHDRAAPVEQARLLADTIPGARLAILPGRSHLPYGGDTELLVRTIRTFLGLPGGRHRPPPQLTPRQRQVVALVSQGLTNRAIGERLQITERSVEGHLERIRTRLGLGSRVQLATWWQATELDTPGRVDG